MLATITSSSRSAVEKRALKKFVINATLPHLRPEVWRLDLNKIASNRGIPLAAAKAIWINNAKAQIARNPLQRLQPDEYLIQDLQQSGTNIEYEVIIEG
jgi:hypothetical protein